MDRATRCIVGWAVVEQRTFEGCQDIVDQGPRAQQYFSDGFPLWTDVYYAEARYQALQNKSETYSVEGQNAELRYYLARLHRSTRCFSKSIEALRRAVGLFVHFWNQRQLRRRARPQYPLHLIDCVSLRV